MDKAIMILGVCLITVFLCNFFAYLIIVRLLKIADKLTLQLIVIATLAGIGAVLGTTVLAPWLRLHF
ncbi:MAG: hypothetical protein KAS46_08300 [Candidatus Aureabacteria bacterium]|nr:hypothetical protein [Candidatus Auribacterota bacterium]